jgi:Fe-S-cluster-containing dehydrogenase component
MEETSLVDTDVTDQFMIVQCENCVIDGCALGCWNDAVAFTTSGILVDNAKCALCANRGSNALPRCIAACAYARNKVILKAKSIIDKRDAAVSALALQ